MSSKYLGYFRALSRVYIFFGWIQIFLLIATILLRSFDISFFSRSFDNWYLYDFLFEAILWTNAIAFLFIILFYSIAIKRIKRRKLPTIRRRRFIWLYVLIIGALNGVIFFDIFVYFLIGDRYYLIIIGFFLIIYFYFRLHKTRFLEIIGESNE